MVLAGGMAIVAGWMMIMPLQRQDKPAGVRRWRRYAIAVAGSSVLTAGMAAIVQARF